jgi:putative sigma-54 modulation protein
MDYVTAALVHRCQDGHVARRSGLPSESTLCTLNPDLLPASTSPVPPPPNVPHAADGCVGFATPSRKEDLMNLTISGHHLEVTPALREYVINKLDRVTRHFDQVVDITVLLTVEKQKEKERRQRAEVNLHVKGRDIYVEHASEDLYAAIDQLVDKLDRQVCRHKDRVQDHHHATAKRFEAST